ncbi:MAG: hypothetical protein ACYTGG_12625, partial [Planctomycetota bacterium]
MRNFHRRSVARHGWLCPPIAATLAMTLAVGLPGPGAGPAFQSAAIAAPLAPEGEPVADQAGRERLAVAARAALGLRGGAVVTVPVPEVGHYAEPIEVVIAGRTLGLDVQEHSVRASGYVLRA